MGPTQSPASSKYFAQFTAFLSLSFGAFIFAGWVLGLDALTNLVPGWPRISRLTALGFMAAGLAQWLCSMARTRLALAVSLLLTAIGLLALLRYAFSWTAYIDQLTLAPMPPMLDGQLPPRMAPSTAVAFCLMGLSLLTSLHRATALAHQTLAIIVIIIGWMGLSRFVFG